MKPCPKCKAPGKLVRVGAKRRFFAVRCTECDIDPYPSWSPDEAVERWDKRRKPAKKTPLATAKEKERHRRYVFEALPADHPDKPAALNAWRRARMVVLNVPV